ncbi:MAG: inositol monophosphatase family protein [Nanoarchaeota archaeon]
MVDVQSRYLNAIQAVMIDVLKLGAPEIKQVYRELKANPALRHANRMELVTDCEDRVNNILFGEFRQRLPDLSIVSEHGNPYKVDGSGMITFDPIDGTKNLEERTTPFVMGASYAQNSVPLAGVILNPMNGDLMTAIRNEGAFFNGVRIRVTDSDDFSKFQVHYHLPETDTEARELTRMVIEHFPWRASRAMGSSLSSLMKIACGSNIIYVTFRIKPHDCEAGVVGVWEAGGFCKNAYQEEWSRENRTLFAGPVVSAIMNRLLTRVHDVVLYQSSYGDGQRT